MTMTATERRLTALARKIEDGRKLGLDYGANPTIIRTRMGDLRYAYAAYSHGGSVMGNLVGRTGAESEEYLRSLVS